MSAATLLSDERASAYIADLEADYVRVRQYCDASKPTPLVSLAEARANKTPSDWTSYPFRRCPSSSAGGC